MNPHDLSVLPDPGLHPALAGADLAAALAAVSATGGTAAAQGPHGLALATRLLAASAPRWRRLLGDPPAGSRHTRLAWTATAELWLVEWAPGAATRAHDHHGATVALTVLDGALVEDCLDATIWTTCRRTTFRAGSTAVFDPGHVHLLAAAGVAAASVHAWSSGRLSRSAPAVDPRQLGDADASGSGVGCSRHVPVSVAPASL